MQQPVLLVRNRATDEVYIVIVQHRPTRFSPFADATRARVRRKVLARIKHLRRFGLPVVLLTDDNEGEQFVRPVYAAAGGRLVASHGPDHIVIFADDVEVESRWNIHVEGLISDHGKMPVVTVDMTSPVTDSEMSRVPSRFTRPPKGNR